MTSNDRDHVAKARELLAAEYERDGFLVSARRARNPSAHVDPHAIRAIVAALTAKREADAPAVVGGWRAKAAEWLEAQAGEQEANNARWPEHAAAYKSWRDRPAELRILASKLLAAPTPPAADGECKCVDCFGTEPGHSSDCAYMAEIASADQPAADTGRSGDAIVDDLIDAGRTIERYSHPSMQPLSKTDFVFYNNARKVEAKYRRMLATPAPAVGVPSWVRDECLEVLRNVDTQFRATGQPSARVERLINMIAGLPVAPAVGQRVDFDTPSPTTCCGRTKCLPAWRC